VGVHFEVHFEVPWHMPLISGVREFSDITVFDGIVLELMTHHAFEAAFLRPTCEQIYC